MADKKQQVEEIDELDEMLADEVDEDEVNIVKPEDMAKQLGMKDAKRIRAFLRQEFPRSKEEKNTSWVLTEKQQAAVIARFTPAEDDDEDTDEES